MTTTKPSSLLAALALGLAPAGCGDDDGDTASTAPEDAATATQRDDQVVTTDQGTKPIATLEVTETEYRIRASRGSVNAEGVYTFEVVNRGRETHALEVEGENGESETKPIAAGETAKLEAYLVAGRYELYCPIGDHADKGMKAKLTVKG